MKSLIINKIANGYTTQASWWESPDHIVFHKEMSDVVKYLNTCFVHEKEKNE